MGCPKSHLDLVHDHARLACLHSPRRRSVHGMHHPNGLRQQLERLPDLPHGHERLVGYWLQLGCWRGRSNLRGSRLEPVDVALFKRIYLLACFISLLNVGFSFSRVGAHTVNYNSNSVGKSISKTFVVFFFVFFWQIFIVVVVLSYLLYRRLYFALSGSSRSRCRSTNDRQGYPRRLDRLGLHIGRSPQRRLDFLPGRSTLQHHPNLATIWLLKHNRFSQTVK